MRPEAHSNNIELRLECLEESRIVENEMEYADTLDSQRTVQAEVQEAIPDDTDANFVVSDSQQENVIAGSFPNVAIYMTEQIEDCRSYRWTYTQLVGSLKVTIFGEINDVPLAMIQVFSTDQDGNELEPLFTYELPLNFKHDCDMSDTLYAVKGLKGQFFGFLFQHPCDKEALSKKMQIL